MRNIAILCLLLVGALPALAGSYRPDEIPNVQRMDRRRYVSNPDGILSAGAVARIDSLCASLRERGLLYATADTVYGHQPCGTVTSRIAGCRAEPQTAYLENPVYISDGQLWAKLREVSSDS